MMFLERRFINTFNTCSTCLVVLPPDKRSRMNDRTAPFRRFFVVTSFIRLEKDLSRKPSESQFRATLCCRVKDDHKGFKYKASYCAVF